MAISCLFVCYVDVAVDIEPLWVLARVLEVFECTCPAEYYLYSVNVCSHMWWCMHCCGRMGSFHGTFLECQVGSFDFGPMDWGDVLGRWMGSKDGVDGWGRWLGSMDGVDDRVDGWDR